MLEFKNVSKVYQGNKPAVEGVTLTFNEGEFIVFIGTSGSGKTTVIRAMLGCLPHVGRVTAGEILYDGKDMTKCSSEEWRHVSGKTAAMIFQDSGSMMDPIRTIGEQFVEYIQTHDTIGAKEAAAQAQDMLARMHLSNPSNVMKSFPFELSGGMRQRVGVAMAMFFRPQLLLADEPTSALDALTQVRVAKELMALRRRTGVAMLLVTHHMGLAYHMADRILVLRRGEMVEQGAREEIFRHPKEAYTKELIAAVPRL